MYVHFITQYYNLANLHGSEGWGGGGGLLQNIKGCIVAAPSFV